MQNVLGRVLSLLAPLLLFLGLLCLCLTSIRSEFDELTFPDDASYVQCVFAEKIQQGQAPGLSADQPSPMTRLAPNAYLLGAVYRLTEDMQMSVYLMGMVMGVLVLFTMFRLGRVLEINGWAAGLSLIFVACNPQTVVSALSADGDGLFVLLISLGLLRYWKKCGRGELGLSLSSMLPVALASALHIEAMVFLVWMGCSSGLRQLLEGKDRANATAALIQVFNGVLLSLICLSPIVLYHLREFNVPWPRYADAVMAFSASGDLVTGASGGSGGDLWGLLTSVGALALPWPGVLIICGAVSALILVGSRRQVALPLDFLTLSIIPAAFAWLLTPMTGPSGLPAIVSAGIPAMILLSVFLGGQVLDLAHERFGLPDMPVKGIRLPALGASVLLILFGMVGVGLSLQNTFKEIQSMDGPRQRVIQSLEQGSGVLASDRPGWLAWVQSEKVVDVEGRYSISVLAR